MTIYCPKCGAQNPDSSNFCEKCGEKLNIPVKKESNHKKIIVLLAIVAVLLVVITLFVSGVFTPEDQQIKLETYDFGYFTMLVPEGYEYREYDSIGKGTDAWAIGYETTVEEDMDVFLVWIYTYEPYTAIYDYNETDGDLEIYNTPYGAHMVLRNVDGYYISVLGDADVDTLKEVSNSIEVKNPKATRIS